MQKTSVWSFILPSSTPDSSSFTHMIQPWDTHDKNGLNNKKEESKQEKTTANY